MKLLVAAALFGAFLGGAVPATAQMPPSEPVALAGGHVTISGDVSGSFAPEDTGFFNYSDYHHSTLRMLQVDVAAAVKATDRLSILGEVRSEDGDLPQPYALYLRFRPWPARATSG